MQRIVVVGPGALGCLFAGNLSRTAEVWLLDHDPARAERIVSEGGIFCEGVTKWNAKVPVTANTDDIGTADLVILCTKSYHTGEALMHAKPIIGEHTAVMSIQNGVGNTEFIEQVVGKSKTFAGITHHAVTLKGEGKIHHFFDGQTIIGSLSYESAGVLLTIQKLFQASGLKVEISNNIIGLLWSKLVINTGINALTAITRLENGKLLEYEGTEKILKMAVQEALQVTESKGIKLLHKDPLAAVLNACHDSRHNRSSMLQDVLRERHTEIDEINGMIVHEGRKLGLNTPVNETLYFLVKTIEQSYALRIKDEG
ncbi:MAG: ketopantoate reductase family protein [Candidatus Omnitrophota bacterium]